MASLSGRATKRGSNQLAVEIRYFLPFKEFLTEANTPCRIESSELKLEREGMYGGLLYEQS